VLALLGAAVFFAIGQAIGSVASTPRAAAAIGQALYFPLMFISNLFVPATHASGVGRAGRPVHAGLPAGRSAAPGVYPAHPDHPGGVA
jgi:hypothetical protein